jgi:hypothetical protein
VIAGAFARDFGRRLTSFRAVKKRMHAMEDSSDCGTCDAAFDLRFPAIRVYLEA